MTTEPMNIKPTLLIARADLKHEISELSSMVMDVNLKTPYAAWIEVLGHVGNLCVRVGQDKVTKFCEYVYKVEISIFETEAPWGKDFTEEEEIATMASAVEKIQGVKETLNRLMGTYEQPVQN